MRYSLVLYNELWNKNARACDVLVNFQQRLCENNLYVFEDHIIIAETFVYLSVYIIEFPRRNGRRGLKF